VQFQRKTSVVHAFGHGFSRRYTLQQGDVHAVLVPHVLEYLFSKIDLRRELLAVGAPALVGATTQYCCLDRLYLS
jgi:alcohol dehydrogenase class IV